MKMIFKIAKTELRNLFYSPVAWFLTIAFLVQCALFFSNTLYSLANWQDVAIKNDPKFKDWGLTITVGIFSPTGGFTANVLRNLYLFVPLLTMGLISREINNGTIKLLYSSPVKLRSIVLGKYLAIMLYNLLLLTIVGVFMATAVFDIKSADILFLVSVLLGYFLLLCAYAAIGMFMSSLSTYQIVSAIGTFTLLYALSYVGQLWQEYDFIRDLTYFLSLSGRTNKMLNGLVSTKDVIYFVLVVNLFVGFTLFKLKGGRESAPWYIKARRYTGLFLITLTIGYITSRPGMIGYWDATRNKLNTIHPKVQEILKGLGNEPMEVILYCNLLGTGAEQGFPANRNVYLDDLWEVYQRFKPDIKFTYKYYYDYFKDHEKWKGKTLKETASEMARGYEISLSKFMPPEEIHKEFDPEPEDYRLVMELKYKGRSTFLRTFDDPIFWPDENNIAAALQRLTGKDLPKVGYVTGNLERDIHKRGEREYAAHTLAKGMRAALINHGYDFDTLSLDRQDIPADLTTLVVADPKVALSDTVIGKLKRYIDQGGNMMILGEPGKQQILNPLLRYLGVELKPGIMVQLSKDEMPNMIRPYLNRTMLCLAEDPALIKLRKKGADTPDLSMPGTVEIAYAPGNGFVVKPLALTHPHAAWVKAGPLVADSAAPIFNAAEGDYKKDSFPTLIAMTRQVGNKEQRIVVSGDADWMSNMRKGGGLVSTALYNWMDYGRYPVYTPRPDFIDTLLTISPGTAAVQRMIFIYILPALVLVLGIVLLIRRKRK
jgi:ABC-2 type transport system permease protein